MNDIQPRHTLSEELPVTPYKDLFIYYFMGRVETNPESLDSTFIGNWQEDDCSFLFFSKPSLNKVEEILSAQPNLTFLDKYHMSYDQWQGGALVPIRVGRITVTPPWKTSANKKAKDELPIILDPGVVFGTGSHPTTQNCLEALEFAFGLKKFESALDLGTETGLLALAAACLGC
jgi:ribosomal protein L11 methyltransferase